MVIISKITCVYLKGLIEGVGFIYKYCCFLELQRSLEIYRYLLIKLYGGITFILQWLSLKFYRIFTNPIDGMIWGRGALPKASKELLEQFP